MLNTTTTYFTMIFNSYKMVTTSQFNTWLHFSYERPSTLYPSTLPWRQVSLNTFRNVNVLAHVHGISVLTMLQSLTILRNAESQLFQLYLALHLCIIFQFTFTYLQTFCVTSASTILFNVHTIAIHTSFRLSCTFTLFWANIFIYQLFTCITILPLHFAVVISRHNYSCSDQGHHILQTTTWQLQASTKGNCCGNAGSAELLSRMHIHYCIFIYLHSLLLPMHICTFALALVTNHPMHAATHNWHSHIMP